MWNTTPSTVKSLRNRAGTQCGGQVGNNGADTSAQANAGDEKRAHHPGDPLLVDVRALLLEYGGDPRKAVDAAGGRVDLADPHGQALIGPLPGLPARQPLAGAGPVHLQNFTQPLSACVFCSPAAYG